MNESDPMRMDAPSGLHGDRPLSLADLHPDPVKQVQRWLGEAVSEGIKLPHAMALATADAEGHPSVRYVLLRGIGPEGFAFYTNRESRKGRDLAANPHAAIVLYWKELDRQVSASGPVTEVHDEASDAYFAMRPREAQLGAWVSRQSEVIEGRDALEDGLAEARERFPESAPVPRPPYWGGYLLHPETIECWQGRRARLHDRFRYSRRGEDDWEIERLSP